MSYIWWIYYCTYHSHFRLDFLEINFFTTTTTDKVSGGDTLYTIDGSVNQYNHYVNQHWDFSKNLNIIFLCDLTMPLLNIDTEKFESAYPCLGNTMNNVKVMQSVWVPINKWMDKENMLFIHNEIWLAIRMEK